jgi:hypothetical protein
MIVADSSVVFALVVPRDAYHLMALATRRRDADWHAPLLFRSEFRIGGLITGLRSRRSYNGQTTRSRGRLMAMTRISSGRPSFQ